MQPLYKFVCVSGRKQIIRGYTNITWNLSDQKRAFNRLKSLVQIVTRHSELSTGEAFSDFEWNEAFRVFHSKWSKDRNVPPLPSVLNNEKGGYRKGKDLEDIVPLSNIWSVLKNMSNPASFVCLRLVTIPICRSSIAGHF